MADKDKPYRYFDIEEEFNSKEVKDLIHFQSTKNNIKEPIDSGKKKVFNPLSLFPSVEEDRSDSPKITIQ